MNRIFDAELHRLLAAVEEAGGEVLAQEHDRLGAHRAVLGAAEGDGVDADVGRQRAERDAERGRGVGEPRAVDVEQHVVRVRPVGERGDRVRGVDGAELRALGDREHARLHDVLVADPLQQWRDQLGREPAVGRVDDQQLAAGAFRCATFIYVQVR